MVRVKIIFDKNCPILSTDTRKSMLQETIEAFLEGEKILDEEARVKTFFIQVEIPKDPKYIEIEIALNTEKNISSEYCQSLGMKIFQEIKDSRLPNFKEFEGSSFGFQIRGLNYTFWS